MKKTYLSIAQHDAFRHGGRLNAPAADIYWRLLHKPATAKELIVSTGRSPRTVYRALAYMSKIVDRKTGEAFHLVYKKGKTYYANENADLDQIAIVVGTSGKLESQKMQHKIERTQYRNILKKKNNAK